MRSQINRTSVELVRVPVTPPYGISITDQPVSIAIVARGAYPDDGDLHAAAWDSQDRATLLIGPGHLSFAPGVYEVFVKVTDSPEIPLLRAGFITVV